MSKAYKIHINGIVQGVGFRPFVYRIAQELGIKGWVNNSSDGVVIHAEGEKTQEFYEKILQEKPPLAVIMTVDLIETTGENFTDFTIIPSRKAAKNEVLISPDVATCQDCLEEMRDRSNRRYLYPFINCTNCGPRYSIIYDRPYDRPKTTMKDFKMCPQCQEEYEDPENRRFHAQPIACENCGPKLKLLDSQGTEVVGEGIGIDLLSAGAILAVKGIGGFHLVCNAYDHKAVSRLRKLKERGAKPFALMAKDVATVSREVELSGLAERILSEPAAPIVLLPRNNCRSSKISSAVAPGLHTLGIILPYTPLHHLLFSSGEFDFLVMTSANLSGRPLIYENETALEELNSIADYLLIHDRDIYHPVDDSVIQIIGDKITFIRRARGYVPLPLILSENIKVPLAGLGGEMKNAFCLASGNMAFMSQYIGDMHSLENFERFKQEFESYQKVANISPQAIAYDLHPDYATTKMAQRMDCPKYRIQHHHAHHVAVMGEYQLETPLLGLICDGTGYGEDGKIWGFEFLFGDSQGYKRLGHLEYLPLPGGDAGAKHPLRIAYAYLRKIYTNEEWELTNSFWQALSSQEIAILDGQIKSGFQLYDTSSAGRLFDVISALLGICTKVTYEGQAAIELESTAARWQGPSVRIIQEASDRLARTKDFLDSIPDSVNMAQSRLNRISGYNEIIKGAPYRELYPVWLDVQGEMVILKIDLLLRKVVSDCLDCRLQEEIAFRFHYSLALAMLEAAMLIGIQDNTLLISGGVFQNKLLTETLLTLGKKAEIEILYPTKLPAGDGGLALGQVLIANSASV